MTIKVKTLGTVTFLTLPTEEGYTSINMNSIHEVYITQVDEI